ncbi:hypothetical protein BGX38DRAFT_599427 [Terfezia claveryi]|nr:hypothetical protein BGX38DRAFT_599427 [Terfezia claveryi]
MTRQTPTTSKQQSRVLSPSPPPHNSRVDRDSPNLESDSQHHPEPYPDSDSQRQPPGSTPGKRQRPATTSNPSQASRKRKATKLQNELSSQVHQYLSENDPSLWSLEHLKTVIGKKYPAKQKWYLLTQLEEICRTSLPDSSEAGAARRLLRALNPRKNFSAPMATFSIASNAPSASTVIYAQQSTINTSPVFASSLTEASEDRPAASDTTLTYGNPVTPTRGNTPSHLLAGSPSLSQSSRADYGPYEMQISYTSIQTSTQNSLCTLTHEIQLWRIFYVITFLTLAMLH